CCLALAGCTGVARDPGPAPIPPPASLPSSPLSSDRPRTPAEPTSRVATRDFESHGRGVVIRPVEASNAVRTQCVVVATVYDDNGEPRPGRRVDWTLEGAGQIVEVAEGSLLYGRGRKIDNHNAVTFTDAHEHTIKGGTGRPEDEIVIRPGHTWGTIS